MESRVEKLEALRAQRRARELPRIYDFNLGPPKVDDLEGNERLNVLRSYRYHLEQTQALTQCSSPVAAGMSKPKDELPTVRNKLEPPSSLSGAINVMEVPSFEAEVTEPSTKDPVGGVDELGSDLLPLSSAMRTDHDGELPLQINTQPSSSSPGGAAGLLSSRKPSEYAWLQSGDEARKTRGGCVAYESAARHILAPENTLDGIQSQLNQERMNALRQARQELLQKEMTDALTVVTSLQPAGKVQSEHRDAKVSQLDLSFMQENTTCEDAPVTVGLTKAASMEAKRTWRLKHQNNKEGCGINQD